MVFRVRNGFSQWGLWGRRGCRRISLWKTLKLRMLRHYRGRMTNRTRTAAALAGSLVAFGMLSACAPQPEPEPEPTAVFASEEEAFKAAEETYRAYNKAYDAIRYEEPSTFEAINQFLGSDMQAEDRKAISERRAEGVTRSGELAVVWFRGESFEDGTVLATACNDISGIDVKDSTGASLVSPSRTPRHAVKLTFTVHDDSVRLEEVIGAQEAECS